MLEILSKWSIFFRFLKGPLRVISSDLIGPFYDTRTRKLQYQVSIMLNHDRDEELSMFLEMRRREKEHRGESLLTGSDNISINGALTTAAASALSSVSSQRYPLRRTAAENFLYSENEKSDYDWLLTPPGTPQFEKESHRSVMNQLDAPNSRPTVLKSRLGNCGEEMISGNNNKTQISSSSSSVAGLRRPSSSSSSRSASRPSTPTNRSTSRPSTPTRRSTTTTTTSTTKPFTTRASTSRSSTPTSRATLTAARATTSTAAPTSTGSARSATPTRSKTQPPCKKPLSRPSSPSIVSSKAPSRGTSPTPTVKPSKPEMPGFSLDAPPNLRTTLPNRPVSASRGRPGVASAPGSRSSSIERSSGGGVGHHARRQSCSPSRRQAPIANTNKSLPGPRVRGKANKGESSNDSFSPVAMGNKMVERVVHMRKLGPPRVTENGVKSNSAFNSLGYGRNLSKSSIDMALRHMDIRRGGMIGNLRPLVTKVPASSVYSVRSRSTSDTNSPVATSSTMSSSELSVDNMNILCLDGNDAENDDLLSERSYS